jgi:lipid II:glycine glycyltransferase (peptidoglycan interpeptide bridge formation enzyme)
MSGVTRGLPDSSWDHDLFEVGGHFMQSGAWMAVQQALGDEIVHCAGQGWRFSAVLHRGRGVSWLYAPYGPALQDESHLESAVGAVRDAGRDLGVDFVRVEPDLAVAAADGGAPAGSPGQSVLEGMGAVRARPVQPRHTLVLDLRRSEEDLRADMLSGRRRSINAAARKGISVRRTREGGEVEQFIRLVRKTGQRSRFEPHSATYYRTLCQVLFARQAASLYLADVGGEAVAAVIAFESPTTGYYAHAADDPETSRQIVAAAPLAWQIVLDCRAAGRSTFDFWGVIPDDAGEHPWGGFSRFKKTFGGRMLTRPGTFDLPLRPLRYRAYRTMRELRAGRRGPAPP